MKAKLQLPLSATPYLERRALERTGKIPLARTSAGWLNCTAVNLPWSRNLFALFGADAALLSFPPTLNPIQLPWQEPLTSNMSC
jgi:hypothetical protein